MIFSSSFSCSFTLTASFLLVSQLYFCSQFVHLYSRLLLSALVYPWRVLECSWVSNGVLLLCSLFSSSWTCYWLSQSGLRHVSISLLPFHLLSILLLFQFFFPFDVILHFVQCLLWIGTSSQACLTVSTFNFLSPSSVTRLSFSSNMVLSLIICDVLGGGKKRQILVSSTSCHCQRALFLQWHFLEDGIWSVAES